MTEISTNLGASAIAVEATPVTTSNIDEIDRGIERISWSFRSLFQYIKEACLQEFANMRMLQENLAVQMAEVELSAVEDKKIANQKDFEVRKDEAIAKIISGGVGTLAAIGAGGAGWKSGVGAGLMDPAMRIATSTTGIVESSVGISTGQKSRDAADLRVDAQFQEQLASLWRNGGYDGSAANILGNFSSFLDRELQTMRGLYGC